MKKISYIFYLLLLLSSLSCSKQSNNDCQNDPSKRAGARCKDGTQSTATGSGACASHGGVDYWICK